MKRIISVLVIFLIALLSVSARPECWLGVGVVSNRDYISDGMKTTLAENPEMIENELYKKGNFSYLSQLGPYYEIMFFPYDAIKVGLYGAGSTSFITGIENKGYRSINLDLRQNARIGIAYNQFFGGNKGLYADIAYDHSWYRFATSNDRNSKVVPDYLNFNQSAIYADFGYLVSYHSSYYKIGFSCRKPFGSGSDNAFSLGICFGGGIFF